MSIISKFKQFRSKAGNNGQENPEAEKEMSFLDHLEELRWHLIRSFIALAVLAVGVFVYRETLLDIYLKYPMQEDFPLNKLLCRLGVFVCGDINVDMQAINPYELFLKAITFSLTGAFIIGFPYIAWEIWRFIKPGLHPREQKRLRGNVFIISMLFFTGISFAYFVILPFSIRFLATFPLMEGIKVQWRIGNTISFVSQVLLAGGIMFQMPIVVFYLAKLGLITPELMKRYRRHSIVILLVLSAIITPPDVMSQILIFIPLSILYEISVKICAVVTRNREKELAS